jgi:hypothetical protein
MIEEMGTALLRSPLCFSIAFGKMYLLNAIELCAQLNSKLEPADCQDMNSITNGAPCATICVS